MAEISQRTLAIMVFATLVVTVGAAVINLSPDKFGLTGFATSDTGNVTLVINGSLNIQVDTNNKTIAFGTCQPRSLGSYWCASNDGQVCDNTTLSLGNCTGDNITQYIRVSNVGNLNASVNVTSSCTALQLIGGTGPAFNFITTNCDATNQSTWTPLAGAIAACNNTVPGDSFRLYVNVTVPQDAGVGASCNGNALLTFSAT